MKLFLTSSCVSENLRERFLKLLGKDPREAKVYFVPTATDVEENKFYTMKSLDDLAEMGMNPIWYSLRFKTKELIEKELSNADVIWVGGGNSFYLLSIARKTGFLDVANDLVRNKGVLYGGISAGTILANPSVKIAGWVDPDHNDVGLADFKALGFVDFLTHVHFEPDQHREFLLSKKTDTSIYAIPNGGAVVIEDGRIETLGGVEVL